MKHKITDYLLCPQHSIRESPLPAQKPQQQFRSRGTTASSLVNIYSIHWFWSSGGPARHKLQDFPQHLENLQKTLLRLSHSKFSLESISFHIGSPYHDDFPQQHILKIFVLISHFAKTSINIPHFIKKFSFKSSISIFWLANTGGK